MKYRLEHMLDECLARLSGGAELESVLADFPEYADELRPLLSATEWMRDLVPPPTGKRERKSELMETVAARRRLVEAAEGVVVEVRAGVPQDELFARCPNTLHHVILAARTLRDAEPPWPAAERREAGKRRLMMLAAQRRTASRASRKLLTSLRSDLSGLERGLAPRPSLIRRLRTVTVSLSLAAAVALVGTAGMAPAAASSLPGEPLYHVKRLGENAQLLVTFDPERRVSLRAIHARRRLDEMVQLQEDGAEIPVSLFESWLSGQAGMPDALSDLSSDQRRMLADMIDHVDAPSVSDADAVLAELRALSEAEAAEAAARLAEQEEMSAVEPAGYDWAANPQPRPLPDEPDPPVQVSEPTAPADQESAPSAIVDRPVDEAPGAVQAVASDDEDRGSSTEPPASGGDPGAGDPGSGGVEPPSGVAPPSAGEAPAEPPPPFVQPDPPPAPDDPPGGEAP